MRSLLPNRAAAVITAMIIATPMTATAADTRPAPSQHNIKAFHAWLQALDQDDPRSIELATANARTVFSGTATARADRLAAWRALVALHEGIMARWSVRLAANRDWSAALDCRFASRCPKDGGALPHLNGLLRSLAMYGGVVEHDGSGSWLAADAGWLANQCAGVGPEDELAFARLRARDRRHPLLESGVLIAPVDQVRERLTSWQDARLAHPTSSHAAAADQRIATLAALYLDPKRWTPGSADNQRLDLDRRQSYRRLLRHRPESPQRAVVAQALRALTAAQPESAALAAARQAVEQAAAEVRKLRQDLIRVTGDARATRRVVSAFSRWAKASDRRLAWLASGLSRDEAVRLSTYASERLFPQVEQMMRRIGARAGADATLSKPETRNLPGGPRP